MAVQQDYILREIEKLGRLAARLKGKTRKLDGPDDAEFNEALLLAGHLQEKNFGMPAAEFLRLTVDEQIATLCRDTSRTAGHSRCLTYATILRETAALYEFRDQDELALGARQLALTVALSVALDQPADAETVHALVEDLRTALGDAPLHPPTRELLDGYARLAK